VLTGDSIILTKTPKLEDGLKEKDIVLDMPEDSQRADENLVLTTLTLGLDIISKPSLSAPPILTTPLLATHSTLWVLMEELLSVEMREEAIQSL
jgi:hypothetical protein